MTKQNKKRSHFKYKETKSSKASRRKPKPINKTKDLGRFKPMDDYLLITGVEQTNSLKTVLLGTKFSCRFTFEEISNRWTTLMYDQKISGLAIDAIRNLHPEMIEKINRNVLFSPNEEEILGTVTDLYATIEDFEALLSKNKNIFHESRSANDLFQYFQLLKKYHLLPYQTVKPLNEPEQVLSFSDTENQINAIEDFNDDDFFISNELKFNNRHNVMKIRNLENELERWSVLTKTQTPNEMDNQTLAVLNGSSVRFRMKSPEITFGRNTKENKVDMDFSLEGIADKISRRQGTIRLRKNGDFFLTNNGKRPIFLNGFPLISGQKCKIWNNSVIEVGGLSFVFLINQELLGVIRQEDAKLSSYESHDHHIQDLHCKVYKRCEFIQELIEKYNFKDEHAAKVSCIAEGALFDTSRINYHWVNLEFGFQNYKPNYGIFQISSEIWCSETGNGGICNINCKDLTNDDLSDDVECLRKIISDTDLNEENWNLPWIQTIIGENPLENTTASIISDSFLITTATQLKKINNPKAAILNTNSSQIPIEQIFYHPKYVQGNAEYDLALIKLKSKVRWYYHDHPTCVGSENIGNDAYQTQKYNDIDIKFDSVRSVKISNEIENCHTFSKKDTFYNNSSNSFVCFQNSDYHVPGVCQVPYGSPIIRKHFSVTHPRATFVKGLTVQGNDCTFTLALNTSKHYDWMNSIIFNSPETRVDSNDNISEFNFQDFDLIPGDVCVQHNGQKGVCKDMKECDQKTLTKNMLLCSRNTVCC
uniref:CSON006037 protein n=1 Tax=Culicoides sonorensis TaxID=179676 RepID=A0A336LJD3_CULSO